MDAQPWWKHTPIYHVYPRSFRDTNGDGFGDLPGITEKIPYLASLGVGALWMGPVFRSPQVDNGYDISDYRDIDPVFGSLDDMDRLIGAAHGEGIRVLLDLVFNHSSNQHPWFCASENDPDGPYGDFYIWRDAPEEGGLPNNWRSFFSVPAWSWSHRRGQYYLHMFAPEQPDLNWENPRVREELAAVANFWLQRGVDGFRLDVINVISKAPGLPSIPESAAPCGARAATGRYIDGPRVLEFLQEFRSRLKSEREIVLVGETPGVSIQTAQRYTAAEHKALDMVLLFDHLAVDHGPGGRWDPAPWTPGQLAEVIREQQTGLSGSSWPSLYVSNHDQPRVVSRYGSSTAYRSASATAIATLFYLLRGTPILYQGDEIAMANYPLQRPEEIVDIESSNAFRDLTLHQGIDPHEAFRRVAENARDNSRTPMQWTGETHGGFTVPEATPWFPVNPDHTEWNVMAQEEPGNDSVLQYHRKLLALRAASPALREGDFCLLTAADSVDVIAYRRTRSEQTVTVVVNLSPRVAALPADGDIRTAEVLLRNYPEPDVGERTLAPYEAVVLETRPRARL